MKTNIYNKEEHVEGYVGTGNTNEKSAVQKEYDKGNEANDVQPYGKEAEALIKGNPAARDGFDNSGTQGKDSLSDDTYKKEDSDAKK